MNEATLFEREFELRFLKARGTAFQDLFSDVMERGFGADFQRVRPHGKLGDLKCDGYRRSDQTVFQVYGPDDFRKIAKLLTKIRADFGGALNHWGAAMSRWVFVHNSQAGLPAPAVQLFGELQAAHRRAIEPWSYTQLLGVVRSLGPVDLHALLPLPAIPSRGPRLPSLATMQRYWTWLARRDFPALRMTECLRRVDLPIRLISQSADREQRLVQELSGTSFITHDSGPASSPSRFDRYDEVVTRTIRRHRQTLILGDSGSGKTTLLRKLAVDGAARLLARGIRKRSRRTPVLVELWRFGSARSIADLVHQSIAESGCALEARELETLLERGCLLLLLDGLDEVAPDHRKECLAQIGAISQTCPKARVILSSRQLPSLPKDYCILSIGLLADEDIATAVSVFVPRGDLRFDDYRTAEEYVRLVLRPSVRSLCRRPLTLAFLLSTLQDGRSLPKNLYQTYDRLLEWVLAWDAERGDLSLALEVDQVLRTIAYGLCSRQVVHIPTREWLALAAPAVERLRALGSRIDPENILRKLSAIGFLRLTDGNVGFAHRSLQEFLAARFLAENVEKPHLDPVALQSGPTTFLCCALSDATDLLEQHVARCSDLGELVPLLSECAASGANIGRFHELHNALIVASDMSSHLTFSMRGPKAAVFIDEIEFLVEFCTETGAKALSLLRDAALGIIFSPMWNESRSWLECIAEGLDRLGWGGTAMLREFLSLGYYEHGEWIFHPRDIGLDTAMRDDTPEEFMQFFASLAKSDWSSAAADLATLRERARSWLQDADVMAKRERDEQKYETDFEHRNELLPDELEFVLDVAPPKCARCDGVLQAVPNWVERFTLVDLLDGRPQELRIAQQRYSCECGATIQSAQAPERTSPGSPYALRLTVACALEIYGGDTGITPATQAIESKEVLWGLLNILAHRVETSYDAVLRALRVSPSIGLSLQVDVGRGAWPTWHLRGDGIVAYSVSAPKRREALAHLLGSYSGTVNLDSWAAVYRWLEELGRSDTASTLSCIRALLSPPAGNSNYPETPLAEVKKWLVARRDQPNDLGALSRHALASWGRLSTFDLEQEVDTSALQIATSIATNRRYGPSSRRDAEIAATLRTLIETANSVGIAPAEYIHAAATSDDPAGLLPASIAPAAQHT